MGVRKNESMGFVNAMLTGLGGRRRRGGEAAACGPEIRAGASGRRGRAGMIGPGQSMSQTRRVSATLQAWAGQPCDRCGDSPSKISAIWPMQPPVSALGIVI